MSKVLGCQPGYKKELIKCTNCEHFPSGSNKCMEFTHTKIVDGWYMPKQFFGFWLDTPIEEFNLPTKGSIKT
ncbi:MAG: hypothetical protein ABFD07_16575 [Methanobacterium sp.]